MSNTTYTETVMQLIELAFDPNPGEVTVGLRDALELLRRVEKLENDAPPMPAPYVHTGEEITLPDIVAAAGQDETAPPGESLRGKNAGRKKDILRRMEEFRAGYGLGAITHLADLSGGKLTTTDIRDMRDCVRLPWAKWELLDKALTIAETVRKENENDG